MAKRPQNEFEFKAEWQQKIFDRHLKEVLRAASYNGGIVFIDYKTSIAKFIQRKAHVDIIAQTPAGGTIGVDVKLVQFPRLPDGRPRREHYRDFFFETQSCSVPGHESDGWMVTSLCGVLLWGQVWLDEDGVDCWPLPFARLRTWFAEWEHKLPERVVPNKIGRLTLQTRGRLAPISRVCQDLDVTGFRVERGVLYETLFGPDRVRLLQTIDDIDDDE